MVLLYFLACCPVTGRNRRWAERQRAPPHGAKWGLASFWATPERKLSLLQEAQSLPPSNVSSLGSHRLAWWQLCAWDVPSAQAPLASQQGNLKEHAAGAAPLNPCLTGQGQEQASPSILPAPEGKSPGWEMEALPAVPMRGP